MRFLRCCIILDTERFSSLRLKLIFFSKTSMEWSKLFGYLSTCSTIRLPFLPVENPQVLRRYSSAMALRSLNWTSESTSDEDVIAIPSAVEEKPCLAGRQESGEWLEIAEMKRKGSFLALKMTIWPLLCLTIIETGICIKVSSIEYELS